MVYDHLAPRALPDWPVQLELALSNACNLQCTMCNGELSSAIRIHRERRAPLATVYDDAFFADLDAFLPHLRSLVLLGGEPFLGAEPLRVLDRLIERDLRPHTSITTNGTVWSARIERIVRALPVHLTFSIDAASAGTFERIRVGADLDAVRANLLRAMAVQAEVGGTCSIAFCLLRDNWDELGDVLAWADAQGLDVFVNQVAHPPAQSLVHAPLGLLEQVVAGLEEEDVQRSATLVRNRGVWDAQLASLRGLLRSRTERPITASAVVIGGRSVVEAGPDQLVRSVEPGAAGDVGIHLPDLLGRPIWHVVRLVGDALGELDASTIERQPDGGEVRTVRFAGPRGAVTMSAELVTADDGSQAWHLAFR